MFRGWEAASDDSDEGPVELEEGEEEELPKSGGKPPLKAKARNDDSSENESGSDSE